MQFATASEEIKDSIAAIKENAKSLADDKKAAESKLTVCSNNLKAERVRIADLKKEKADLAEKVKEVDAKIKASDEECKRLKEEIKEWVDKNTALQKNFDEVKASHIQAMAQVKGLETDKKELEKEVKEEESKIKKLEEANIRETKQLNAVQVTNAVNKEKLEQAVKDLREAKAEEKDLERQISALKQEKEAAVKAARQDANLECGRKRSQIGAEKEKLLSRLTKANRELKKLGLPPALQSNLKF